MAELDPILDLLNERPREDWSWDFDPAAEGESAVNAVALCNAAVLSYSAETDVKRFLAKWGFEEPRILRGFLTQGFVARRGNIVVLAFRGTEPINADDWLSNLKFHQRVLAGGKGAVADVPGLVHGGFATGLAEVTKQIQDAVTELAHGEEMRFFVTGHSLGGALAVLAAALFHFGFRQKIAGVFTYGQPRVGDPAFSTAFDQALGAVTFRYVNDLDLVPHVPSTRLAAKPMLQAPRTLHDLLRKARDLPREIHAALDAVIEGERFSHVGQLLLFRRDGSITSDEQEWQNREAVYSGTLSELLGTFPGLLRAQLGQLLRTQNRILDHDPVHGYLPKLEARLR
jgi:triacylglycerol lipase